MYDNHLHDLKDPQYTLKIMADNNTFFITFSIFIFMIISHRNYWMTYQKGQVILVKR